MKITTYKCDVCKQVFDNSEKIVGIRFGNSGTFAKHQRFAESAEYDCWGHVCCECVDTAKRLFDSRKPKPVKAQP